LVLRTWESGDWVALGGGGRQKLQDWFVNRRVPRYARRHLVLAAVGKRVLWVVGLATFSRERGWEAAGSAAAAGGSLVLRLEPPRQ